MRCSPGAHFWFMTSGYSHPCDPGSFAPTGTVFQAPEGASPERDGRGELAFRAISYTPWPVEEGAEGERLRIDVGTVGERQPRTFVFSKVTVGPAPCPASSGTCLLPVNCTEVRCPSCVAPRTAPLTLAV